MRRSKARRKGVERRDFLQAVLAGAALAPGLFTRVLVDGLSKGGAAMKTDGFCRTLIGLTLIGGLAGVFTGYVKAASVSPGPPRADSPDLVALHDASSPSFNRNCLSCHGDIMKRTTLNKKFKEAHGAMVPFMPGYNVKQGITNKACVSCHGKMDLLEHSGEQIRRNANVSACVACHSKSGPSSKKFYAN